MYGADSFFRSKFEMQNQNYKDIIDRVLWRRDLSSPLSEFLGIAVMTVLLWVGANQVFSDALSPAVFFAFIFAFYQVIEPAKSFATAYYNVQKGLGALDRIDGMLSEESSSLSNVSGVTISRFEESIRFQNVSFRYETDWILQDLTFEIKKGETVAIVGASGSGKTTITDLLLKFYSPDKGDIHIDNQSIQGLNTEKLRSLFSVVNQHPILFHDTVVANIAMAEEVNDIAIKASATKAFAHEFITNLDNSYETIIGSEGMKLSGGERQRICLARALYRDAPIVILDEATSSVDAESEHFIQQAMDHILKDKTAIIIAHKIGTIRNADRIIVLEDGEIIQTGSHEVLLNSKSADHYRKIVELQTV